jgi:hypothetical protein
MRIHLARDLAAWAGVRQQQISDRVHAPDEALARARGWAIGAGTGRFGFGDRVYQDPRFGSRVSSRLPDPLPSPLLRRREPPWQRAGGREAARDERCVLDR